MGPLLPGLEPSSWKSGLGGGEEGLLGLSSSLTTLLKPQRRELEASTEAVARNWLSGQQCEL